MYLMRTEIKQILLNIWDILEPYCIPNTDVVAGGSHAVLTFVNWISFIPYAEVHLSSSLSTK